MNGLKKILAILPYIGIIAGFVLIIIVASVPNTELMITGLVLVHVSIWALAVRFIFIGVGFFSTVLSSK